VYTDDGGESYPAYIRAFLPGGFTPLEDNTTVFLYGKIFASCRSPFIIESIGIFRYPGNPSDPHHGSVPAFTPRLCILGNVQDSSDVPTQEGHRVFTALSSAWVQNQVQTSSFT